MCATEAYGYAGASAAQTGLFPSYLDNQGKVGDHSGQFMARIASCLTSLTADLWMLLSRTNDSTTPGMTLADSKANVMKVITAFQNMPGKYLIVGTGTPPVRHQGFELTVREAGGLSAHEKHSMTCFGIPKISPAVAGNTKPPGTQKTSKAPKSLETPLFTGFQAQKKTSVDVFR